MDYMIIDQFALFAQNDMYQRDLLVAAIAACLGLNLIYAAATDNDWTFELGSVAAINDAIGRAKTRLVIAFVGTSLLAVGAHLVAASRIPEKSFRNDVRSRVPSKATKPPQSSVVLNTSKQSG